MKTIRKLIGSLVMPLILSFCLFSIPAQAEEYNITIEKNGKLTDNGEIIFSETDIAPGFSNSYSIDFINQSDTEVNVFVEKITADSTSPNTGHFFFDFSGNLKNRFGGLKDFNDRTPALLNIPKNSSGKLDLGFALDVDAGNEYQNTTTKFSITFRVDAKSDSAQTGSIPPPLVWSTLITGSIALLLLAIIIIIKPKRKEKTNDEE